MCWVFLQSERTNGRLSHPVWTLLAEETALTIRMDIIAQQVLQRPRTNNGNTSGNRGNVRVAKAIYNRPFVTISND